MSNHSADGSAVSFPQLYLNIEKQGWGGISFPVLTLGEDRNTFNIASLKGARLNCGFDQAMRWARLFQVAPELLQAVKAYLYFMEDILGKCDGTEDIYLTGKDCEQCRVRALIARIEGGAK